jgi:hypothetical protein
MVSESDTPATQTLADCDTCSPADKSRLSKRQLASHRLILGELYLYRFCGCSKVKRGSGIMCAARDAEVPLTFITATGVPTQGAPEATKIRGHVTRFNFARRRRRLCKNTAVRDALSVTADPGRQMPLSQPQPAPSTAKRQTIVSRPMALRDDTSIQKRQVSPMYACYLQELTSCYLYSSVRLQAPHET